MQQIGIGLLGFGNVGSGVVRTLLKNADLIAVRTGFQLLLKKIAVRDCQRERPVQVDPSLLTSDAESVISDSGVDVVVELIGGTDVARVLTLKSLAMGKPVVTANKALLAECGDEIFGEAERRDVDLYFEACVAGGIPIVQSLREGLIANHIHSIFGILNGTCNYILTRMQREGLPLDVVLKEAQASGYAEAEPGLDIDGWDAAHKAVILASISYGFHAPMGDVLVQGIREVVQTDIRAALELGFVIKLLAAIQHVEEGVAIRVQPALVPQDAMLASVNGVFNAVLVDGDVVGETLYYGRGAGADPTASAVVSDLVNVSRNLVAGSQRRVPALAKHHQYRGMRSTSDLLTRYYLRFTLADRPGVLAKVTNVLGRNCISIASMNQKDPLPGEHAEVIIVTHASQEHNYDTAISEIDQLDGVVDPTVRYRIEDFHRIESGRVALNGLLVGGVGD